VGIGTRELLVVAITAAIIVLSVWPYARILRRLGYSPWPCVLVIIPLVNIIFVWVLAYANWPALRGAALGPTSS